MANYHKDFSSFQITLPSSSNGSIIKNLVIKDAVERKARMLIDPSNTNGDPSHVSLGGTIITLARVHQSNTFGDSIAKIQRIVIVTISKTGLANVDLFGFSIGKSR